MIGLIREFWITRRFCKVRQLSFCIAYDWTQYAFLEISHFYAFNGIETKTVACFKVHLQYMQLWICCTIATSYRNSRLLWVKVVKTKRICVHNAKAISHPYASGWTFHFCLFFLWKHLSCILLGVSTFLFSFYEIIFGGATCTNWYTN